MSRFKLLIAAAALAVVSVPIAASADPAWGGHDDRPTYGDQRGWGDGDHRDGDRRGFDQRGGDRGDWRDRGGRDIGDQRGWSAPGWGYRGWGDHGWGDHAWDRRADFDGGPRCFLAPQGYYNYWGDYRTHLVRVCR
jgi:hypothetical protein